ncbi:hypothetical protein PILCRDRAFT_473128 [Piloderma croceum F 1598]|uniref:C2 domain-containing protein n=1 Tax=Piloderma croceum (strain F 1598) TaxID=765440 RepID=A0A0C3FTR3_PILCF|nr:hypothetical protein PILCRDRAFT_473128 [Piloderma croceum F 1598]
MGGHEKIPYHLKTIHGRSNKPPNPYIRLEVDTFTARTKSIKRTSNPVWNEGFTFAALSSSTICIRAKNDAAIFKPQLLGEVAVVVETLLATGKDMQDVVLKLRTAGANGETQERGEITVRFWTEETVQASATAIAGAHQAVEDKLEDDSSPAKSMEAIVSKLKVFADIVDEAAKVWKLACVMEY